MSGLWGFNSSQSVDIIRSVKDGVFGFISAMGNPFFAFIFILIAVVIIIGIFSIVVRIIKSR